MFWLILWLLRSPKLSISKKYLEVWPIAIIFKIITTQILAKDSVWAISKGHEVLNAVNYFNGFSMSFNEKNERTGKVYKKTKLLAIEIWNLKICLILSAQIHMERQNDSPYLSSELETYHSSCEPSLSHTQIKDNFNIFDLKYGKRKR